MATYVKSVKETCMPPLYVEMIRRSTQVGSTVTFQDSEHYVADRSQVKTISAKVVAKSRFLALTTVGCVPWNDIALYQWRRHIES